MSFRTEYSQYHYQLYELVLPYCTVCTPSNQLTEAWHTPVTCEEESDATYSIWLAPDHAPLGIPQPTPSIQGKSRLNSSIFKCVTGTSETTATLKPGEGMASRGQMSITCSDFDGDPGPVNFSENGTFFGKLSARNILESKKIITHYFSIVDGATGKEVYKVGESQHYITKIKPSDGKFTITAKDALKDIEAFGVQFPEPSEVVLTADINETQTSIPVSDGTKYAVNSVFRIDSELFRIRVDIRK